MGANNSSQGKRQSQDDAADVKTSYYELLGVERQAADEEYAPYLGHYFVRCLKLF
jgi:hypothetical protein